MKKLFRSISILLISLTALGALMITASAATHSAAKDGVVFIESTFVPNIKTEDYAVFQVSPSSLDPNVSAHLGSGYYLTYTPMTFRGSGFAIGEPGKPVSYIVTNAHVVVDDYARYRSLDSTTSKTEVNSRRADEVKVYFSYGANDFMRAQIYYINEKKDICVLKLPEPTEKRQPLVLCKSDDVDMDDDFAALGYPGDSDLFMDNTGLSYGIDDITMTRGAISRKSTDKNGVQVYLIDVDIRGGNSGGPLVNSKGEVVGINTYGVGESNYAVVIDELLAAINRDVVPYSLANELAAAETEVSETEAETETEPETEPETEAPKTEAVTTAAQTEAAQTASAPASGVNTILVIAVIALGVLCIVVIVILILNGKKGKTTAPTSAVQPAVGNAAQTAVITGVKGIMAGRSFSISGSAVIGRNPERCTICFPINSQGISGVHCEIRQSGAGYEIIDRGSSCGTFLGSGQKLVPDVPSALPSGMYFYLGSSEQLFQINY